MQLPPATRHRLRLGRAVSAEIRAADPAHRAWIHVEPLLDLSKGSWEQRDRMIEPQFVTHAASDEPLIGFRVRHRELHRRFEQYPDDWDQLGLAIDETFEVGDEQQLVALLTRWLDDLAGLGPPHSDGAPF